MYAKTLAEHVRAYLDLQAFLDECRADGRSTDRAALAVRQAGREIRDALVGPHSAAFRPLADATGAYLEAEHQFDTCAAAGHDLDSPARRMEAARRDLERQLHAASGDDVQQVRARRVLPAELTSPPTAAIPSRAPRRILVPYDESAPARYALEVAARLAREEDGGTLMLVHVVRPATGAGGEYVCSLVRLDALHHRDADQMLAKACEQLPPHVHADQMVREGLPADEILAAAKAWDADLIIIGTRGRGRLAQFLLGGTAETVIRRAPCPVMTVGRRAAWAAGSDEAWPHADQSVQSVLSAV